jgi:Ca-activated chloride channel family protein
MLPPLFILFGLLLTQKEAQANFFSTEVMEKLRVTSNTLTLKARNALFMLIGFLLVIALADPVIKQGTIEVQAKSADIMLALDISDSMLARDVYPNRLKLAKQKALTLLHIAPNERIGVIAFAKNSYLVSPLSFDHDAVGFLLRQLSTDSITEKGTDFLSMLNVVNNSVKEDAKKYVLLFSDGGDKKDFSSEIAYAKAHGITIFILGVGTQKGAPIALENGRFIQKNGKIMITKLNESIAKLATQTGGVYIQSVNANDDIKTLLAEIEKHAEKKDLKKEKIEKYMPLFYYPIGLALLLLLFATSSMSKRESVEVPSAFLLFVLMSFSSYNLHAGLLDFQKLDTAYQAYEAKAYQKSAHIYEQYAQDAGKPESYYNAGNAFYKAKNYKEAIKNYEKARFDTREDRAKNFANMGNAYARLSTQKSLEEAIRSYKEALKIQDDRATRDNLKAVQKALQKMKKKQQKQNQQKKRNQKQKNKHKQNKENKQQSQKNKNKDKAKQDKQHKGKSNKQEEQNKKNKGKSNKQEQQNKKNKVKPNKQEKKDSKQKQKSMQELKKQEKDAKQRQEVTASMAQKKKQMSDAEEKKWLRKLNKQPSTFLYMLNNPKNSIKKEENNDMPW